MTRTKRVAIYCRISTDKAGGGLGVARQEADCRAKAAQIGADVVAVLSDNDVSAYSGKPRPGYRKLLKLVADGDVDAVLVWHTDRLHRSPVELEHWIATAEPHGVVVHTVVAGDLDLATPSGRMNARVAGAVARHESEHKSDRVRTAKAQAATSGKYRGGPRPYGYQADGVTLEPAEADAVRTGTEKILAGESVASVVRWFNTHAPPPTGKRKTPATGAKRWQPVSVRRVLSRARNAGLLERDHRGPDRRREPDILAPAGWPKIVEPAQWRQARRILADPARRVSPSNDHRWMLAGVAVCGRCDDGTTMKSGTARSGGRYVPAYKCSATTHLSRLIEPLDEFVSEVMIARLSKQDAAALLVPANWRPDVDALHTERADLTEQRKTLARLLGDKVLTEDEVRAEADRLQAEIDRIDRELASAVETHPARDIASAEDVATAWHRASVGQRKAVLRRMVTVTVLPAAPGRPPGWDPTSGRGYFDPSAVRIEWQTD